MKYETPKMTVLQLEDEDIIKTSLGEGENGTSENESESGTPGTPTQPWG